MLTRKSLYAAIGLMLAVPLISACEDPLAPTDSPRPELEVQVNPVDIDTRPTPARRGKKGGGDEGGIGKEGCPLDSRFRLDEQRRCS